MILTPATMAPAIQVASIGVPDTLFLMLLALVVFGPRRLPEIGRQIGKLMYEFRKVSNEFKFQMEEELRASEEADRQKKLAAAAPPAPTLNLPFSNTPALDAQAAENPTPELALAAPAPDSPTPSELTAAETTPAGLSSENPASESAVESQPESQPFPNPQPVHGVVAAAKPFRGRIPEPPPPPPDHSLSVAQTEAAESEPEARHA